MARNLRLIGFAFSLLPLLIGPAPALAQAPCEQTFLDPVTGDPTTIAVLIESPLAGADLRSWEGDCEATVRGLASAIGLPPHVDFYIVIDVSGSTRNHSGVDVNGDGIEETVLQAEVAAADAFLDAIDLGLHSVAIVVFDYDSQLVQELTSDRLRLEAALASTLSMGGGTTNFGAPMEVALAEHAAHHDPTRAQSIIFLSDGQPNVDWPYPPGPTTCLGAADRCTGIEWSIEAASRGIVVNTFGVGTGASADVLSEMARVGHGQTFMIDVAGEIVALLPRVVHVGIASVTLRNETTGQAIQATLSPDGRWSATLGTVDGRNDFTVTAVSINDDTWSVSCTTDAAFSCISTGCPTGGVAECDGNGAAQFDGLVAWASSPTVVITNDSPVDGVTPDPADASGPYPLGDTRITWRLHDDQAGDRTCEAVVRVEDSTPPVIQPLNPGAAARCGFVPTTSVSVSDACDPSPRLDMVESRVDGPCPDSFDLVRDWTATDAAGHVTTLRETLQVRDDQGPTLVGVPADATLECPATPPPAVVTAVDACDPNPLVTLEETETPGRCAGERVIHRKWIATDRCGNSAEATQVVSIVDTTPPVIAPNPIDRIELWPPRHDLVRFDATAFNQSVTDACDPGPTWRFTGCTSSQADNGQGDGSTSGDCVVVEGGSAILVRAERSGSARNHGARVYTVLAAAVDGCGNASADTTIATITVPHDRSGR